MKLKTVTLVAAMIYSVNSFALFCPNNFNQINIGDTIAQVQAACGKPDTQKTYKSQGNVPQEWTYYVAIPNAYAQDVPTQGTMKVTFAFVNNQVVNMTSNGVGVGATTVCNNTNLQLGNSIEDVKAACGAPATIVNTNIANENAQGTPPVETSEWTYTSAPGVTLIFENGKLKQRK